MQLDVFVDNTHIELSLWDTAGQEEFDRLRSLSYDDTHAIMLCFSVRLQTLGCSLRYADPSHQVDSKDSLENVESKWVGEIAENCQGVKLVLVALKCDLREKNDDEEGEGDGEPKKDMIDYNQGLAVARRIQVGLDMTVRLLQLCYVIMLTFSNRHFATLVRICDYCQ